MSAPNIFENSTSLYLSTAGLALTNWNHTVSNTHGPNGMLILFLYLGGNAARETTITATFHGKAFTQILLNDYSISPTLYVGYLLNPDVGTYAMAVSWVTQNAVGQAFVVSVYNAAQSLPGSATGTGFSAAPSIPLAVASVNYLCLDAIAVRNSDLATDAGTVGFQIRITHNEQTVLSWDASQQTAATPTTTAKWTLAYSNGWVGAIISILYNGSGPVTFVPHCIPAS